MERLDPGALSGPRAYFTAFDYRIVARTSNRAKLRREVERKLKALLLIKSTIVCAASHLASAFAYDIFRDCPQLLSDGHVVPAFRQDMHDLEELFSRKRFSARNDCLLFYEENIKKTVSWDLHENSGWFRDRFAAELADDASMVRRNMGDLSTQSAMALLEGIRSNPILTRAKVEQLASGLTASQRHVLLNYRELIYHMSGARVVNCESSLPQENYIDYDLADLSQRRAKLSDDQILWKLFIEAVLESFQLAMLPVELLDDLSFKDILLMRGPLLDSTFQEEYDNLVSTAISAVVTPTDRLLDLQQLETVRANLSNSFAAVIDEEAPTLMRKHFIESTKELRTVSSSVAVGLLGFLPGVGSFISAANVIKDTPSLIFNVGQVYRSKDSVSSLQDYVDFREQLMNRSIEHSHISDKATMLDMVQILLSVMRQKLQL
jgi:hypothetical protein